MLPSGFAFCLTKPLSIFMYLYTKKTTTDMELVPRAQCPQQNELKDSFDYCKNNLAFVFVTRP